MEIKEPVSEEEVRATFPVMRELRTHLSEDGYLSAVERMRAEGYRLAGAYDGGKVLGVAGFRVMELLYCGKILYVDDLAAAEGARSKGVGGSLLRWLEDEAKQSGCSELHLDSGVQRKDAHRFYFREGMGIFSFHSTKGVIG